MKQIPQTSYVQQIRTQIVPVQSIIQVPTTKTEMVPVTVNVSVPEQQVQDYDRRSPSWCS